MLFTKLISFLTLILIHFTCGLIVPCDNSTFSSICSVSDLALKKDSGPPFWPSVTFVTPLLELREILEANEDKHTVKILVQLTLKWRDPRVTYKRDSHETDKININLDPSSNSDIWKPDLYFSNSVRVDGIFSFEQETLEFLSYIIENSLFLWTKVVISEFTCQMDFTDYPFDQQKCIWKMRNKRGPTCKFFSSK